MPAVSIPRRAFACCTLLGAVGVTGRAQAAQAAQGIAADSVNFVQVADISGSRSVLTKELNAGTLACFKQVNSQGGVHGRQLRLTTVDDGYVVKRTQEVTREWIEKDAAFAFTRPGSRWWRRCRAPSRCASRSAPMCSTFAQATRRRWKRWSSTC